MHISFRERSLAQDLIAQHGTNSPLKLKVSEQTVANLSQIWIEGKKFVNFQAKILKKSTDYWE